MMISKWKIAKYLLPLLISGCLYWIISSSMPVLQVGTGTIIKSDKCIQHWEHLLPNDSTIKTTITTLLSGSANDNSVNRELLSSLPASDSLLLFERPLAAVFNFPYGSRKIANTDYIFSDESQFQNSEDAKALLRHTDTFFKQNNMENPTFYFNASDVLGNRSSSSLNLYSFNKKDEASIHSIGYSIEECGNMITYTFKDYTDLESAFLLSSPLNIELEFKQFPEVDKLLKDYVPNEICLDCPNDVRKMKSFARLKGYVNLYFMYTEHFIQPNENEPACGLLYIDENNEPMFFWYHGIDLFGCACL